LWLAVVASAIAAPATAVSSAIPRWLWWWRVAWVVRSGGSAVPWWPGQPRRLCDCAPLASWWCPWRRSCGGSSAAPWWWGWWRRLVSLLGDDDAGENPFLLTLSGDGVVGAAGVIPFLKATLGISVAYLGSSVVLRRWPLCEDVFFICCLFLFFLFLCGWVGQKRKEKKVVGSRFSFERGRREVFVPGSLWWLASTAEQCGGDLNRCSIPAGPILWSCFELIVSMSQSDRWVVELSGACWGPNPTHRCA
jgi:hypothetical protein